MDKKDETAKGERKRIYTAGQAIPGRGLVELVLRSDGTTALVHWEAARWRVTERLAIDDHKELAPLPGSNNLIAHRVVLLPSEPVDYGTDEELVTEIRQFIRTYVSVSPRFEHVAAHYVLLSWVYDRFNELPYLRVRGDYGTGKTRFLLTVGSLCYRPIFASGASTVAPIFYSLSTFRGTLIVDEGDFRASDEKADIVKILNNGNARGLPLLRMQVTADGNYTPRAFNVYGPKIVAARGAYDDQALESRFITEEMTSEGLPREVPINLGDDYERDALRLRNKLLLYRFRQLDRPRTAAPELPTTIEPRLRQVFAPLLSVVDDPRVREEIAAVAAEYHEEILAERSMSLEAQVLEAIRDCFSLGSDRVSLQDVARLLASRNESDLGRHITSRWIGRFVRKRLHLRTEKSHGIYVIPLAEIPKAKRLLARHGLASSLDEEASRGSAREAPRSIVSEG